MNVSKYNIETAMGSKNLIDKVSPANNKKNSEFFDDAMVCDDDWLDYDDDEEDKDEGNQSDTAESPPLMVAEEMPLRDNRPSSEVTFVSPKRKRSKFPNFDELLQNLNFDVLNLNFTKLLLFLESTNKELIFLFTLDEYEEFFKMVLEDINILKSKSLDACYRDICDKILKAATGYILMYVYEYKTEFQRLVMVIIKEPINMMDQSEEETSTVSLSKEPTKPSRVANAKALSRAITPTISSGFKIHCLRTMLAFIKYDETKSKMFPELSPDQALYMESLLESNGNGNDFDKNLEVKQLYRALWEAMKIYSLKYEFKIKCVDSWCGKKNLTLKKIPRPKSGTDVDSNQTINLSSETENLETTAPDDAEPWFAKPDIPKLPPVQQNPARLTKRMLQNQIKLENEVLFIRRLPPQFVSDTLNSILDFLLDDEKDKLVFVPKNQPELCFYRKIFDWCRTWYCVEKFGEEFERLHYKISSLLPRFEIQSTKRRANKMNEITGVREVVYIKKWHKCKSGSLESLRSAPKKKKKVNLKNALELAGTEQIQLTSVVDLNQSLRNKKKNKKQKKAKLKRANAASNQAASKGSNKSKTWTDDSSSACSSRSTSRDRAKLVPKPQSVSKRAVNENQGARRHEGKNWRNDEINRKEQLKEALSVPVQSDKAVRMMRGMGWSGGALGARGVGITEPLMPKLDITRGAGLGHIRGLQPETNARKQKEAKTSTSWVSENQTVIEATENDVLVKKTKDLLHENTTFDSIIKTVELPKQSECNVELSKPNVELSKSNVELWKPNVELWKPNVELSKPNVELKKFISEHFSRQEFLNSVLELLNSNGNHITLRYHNRIPSKGMKFVKNFVSIINRGKVNYGIFLSEEYGIYTQILIEIKKLHLAFLEAKFSHDVKAIDLIKVMPIEETPTQQPTELKFPIEPKLPAEIKPTEFSENPIRHNLPLQSTKLNSEIITEERVKSFILSTKSLCTTPKANAILKFKVLFLFNILNFVKSLNEESEVIFNKILTLKEKSYIQNIVDEVNMRIRFGTTPAETKLREEIKEHIADAFLGAMFNHQYTVVTLNKYYRFKRLNRPDNAVKRKCQTNINLDIYKSETVSQVKVNTYYELTDKENNYKVAENNNVAKNEIKVVENCSKVAENNRAVAESCSKVAEFCSKVAENNRTVAESSSKAVENCSKLAENNNKAFENGSYKDLLLESSEDDITNFYDSDESSVEEYDNNNANAKVPSLPPGEEGVNISSFLYLYDKGKTNTSVVRDASNSNNVSASKMTENINNKNNIGNGNVVIDNNDNQVIDMKRDGNTNMDIEITEKETNASDSEIKRSDIVTANDVGLVNLNEKHERIDEVLGNTKDPSDQGEERKETNAIDSDIIHSDIVTANDVSLVNQEENHERIDEVIANNKDPTKKRAILAETWEDYVRDDVFIFTGNTSTSNDTDVIMKHDVIEMMEVISISDNEDVIKITNKQEISEKVTESKESNCNITSDAQTEKQGSNNLDIKTDCDILIKGNIVLSRNNCDTQSGAVKIDTETDAPNFFNNTDTEIKTVRIVHRKHPIKKLNNETITAIQKHISKSIILSLHLPLLKCHGVKNGALIYSCHNEKTYDWLQNTISVVSLLKVLNTEEVTKMTLRLCCFFDCHYLYVCKMIELYNKGLSTKEWVVEKTERDGDHIIFIIKMDKFSIKFIQESGNALFAGVDKVQFNPIWE